MTSVDDIWPCVGVCMPDADEAYCIGCGRPWGEPRPARTPQPEQAPESSEPDDPAAS